MEQLFELARVITLLIHKVEQYPGIEIPAPRAHHESAKGGKPHGGVAGPSILQCRHAGPVAKVGDDHSSLQDLFQGAHDIFIGKAVETVTVNPLMPEAPYNGQPL